MPDGGWENQEKVSAAHALWQGLAPPTPSPPTAYYILYKFYP